MPLLRKKEFQKTSVPELLRDDEEVFHCQVTNEIFRDYDEFCQRIILVNSMVWSCAMTGKTNLTYAEALQSEETAKKSLKDFPIELRIPVLYLASRTRRSGFGEMTEDVYLFVKDRYFVGEIVESSFTENNWRESHVLQVIAPTEEQLIAYARTNGKTGEKSFYPPPTLFRYEIEQLDANDQDSSQVMMLEASHVRRKKGPYTKEKNRLFLKQFVELNEHGIVVIKESTKRKYRLDSVRFDHLFDGPMPEFEQSRRQKPAPGANGKKVVRQETLSKYLEKPKTGQTAANGKSLLEEMKKKEDEYKQKVADMKAKRAEEKNLERQKRKEENIKMTTYVKEWYKPKEDLELEDQKVLPAPTEVQSKIASKYFGDTLMVLEFVNSFSNLLKTKDFFPGGLTMDLLERALTVKEVAGPLTDVVQMLLTALFNVQDEEAAANKESQSTADILSSDDLNLTLSESIRLATMASNWSISHQGMPLGRLPLYPLTVSEVLRLHLLSSGARCNEAASKWRYQQRGGYTSEDDPGLTLRMKHPHILKALAVHNINQLPVSDKIKVLTCLIDQLLTYADVRDAIEEKLDRTKQLKADLRSLQITERRYEQEFVSARLRIKREHKTNPDTLKNELDKQVLDAQRKRLEFEMKTKELTKGLSELQNVLGIDRGYQRYIKVESLPGFFVENDERNPGVCEDRIVVQKPELVNATNADTLVYVKKLYGENGSDKENEVDAIPKKLNGGLKKCDFDLDQTRSLLLCTSNTLPCPVHTPGYIAQWSFYSDKDDVHHLINALNKRGSRESELRIALENDREHLENIIMQTNIGRLNPSLEIKTEPSETIKDKPVSRKIQSMLSRFKDSNLGFPHDMCVSEVLHLLLIDNILEMEEKMSAGNLGHLRVKNREQWRLNLENRNYEELDKSLCKKEDNLTVEKLKSEGKISRPGTPDSVYKDPGRFLGSNDDLDSDNSDNEDKPALTLSNEQLIAVKTLSIALVQVAQAVEQKYLKKPLGHADGTSKKKKEFDVLEKWEQSLLAATSYSQVFLHYCTLDNCIMWTRSALLARCRICHRNGDGQNMLLCDSCNKGHHMYCLKPKLTAVPQGDWFCVKCKPKEEPPTPRAATRTRKIFSEESEEELEEEEDTEEESEEEVETVSSTPENGTEIPLVEVCEECGTGGHVICCDHCTKVYHLECAQPALRRVPRGEWKCHKCRRRKQSPVDDDPLFVVVDEAPDDGDDLYLNRRRCAAKARNKIHGFVQSLRRTSVDSGSGEDTPTRRSTRKTHEEHMTRSKRGLEDDLPFDNVALQELLADVMKHRDAWPFTRPVTKAEVPDYYDVIKTPMDFGTIKYKLNMGEYKFDCELIDDCILVFDNCDTYNNSEARVYKCGVRLLKFFEKRAKELGLKFPDGLMGTSPDDDEAPASKRSRH